MFLLVVAVLDVLHHRGGRGLIDFVIGAGQIAIQTGENAVQLLHLGIGGGVLKLLGRLRDFVLDGRAPLRRVVRHTDIIAGGIDDGRKRFVLVCGPLDGLTPGRLETGAHRGIEAGVIVGQRGAAVGGGDQVFQVLARLKALQVGVQWCNH